MRTSVYENYPKRSYTLTLISNAPIFNLTLYG